MSKTGAGLYVLLDGIDQLLHARIFMALADDVERLGHGYARLQHGGQLTGKNGDILGFDLLFYFEQLAPAPLHLERIDALAA